MRPFLLLVTCLLAWSPRAARASAGESFDWVDLGLPEGFRSLHPQDINHIGQIVGWVETEDQVSRAFVWDRGELRLLDLPGSTESVASGINAAGEIVGSMILDGERHAFLAQTNHVTDLGRIDSVPRLGLPGNHVPGVSINDQGQVACRLTMEDGGYRSLLWTRGNSSWFGVDATGHILAASGINVHGQIVGQAIREGGSSSAFLWHQGELTDLGTLGGGRASATAVNGKGMVIGWSLPGGGTLAETRAFVWTDGTMRDLGGLGRKSTRAHGLNEAGQVVGYTSDPEGRWTAFLWQGDRMFDLNTLIDPAPEMRLTSASAINDHGQIVATGMHGTSQRGYLLSPTRLDLVGLRSSTPRSTEPAATPQPAPPLHLTAFDRRPSGAFHLAFRASPGGRYFVEASTDLVHWTRLGPATRREDRLEFTDDDTGGRTVRFYRVVREP